MQEPESSQSQVGADTDESLGGVLGSTFFVLVIMVLCTSIFLMAAYLFESGKKTSDARKEKPGDADASTAASPESSKKED